MFYNMRWRIAVPFATLILVIMGGLTLFLSARAREAQLADLQTQLAATARLIAGEVGPRLPAPDEVMLNELTREWGNLIEARVTIIAADGRVLADSLAAPAAMDNHLSRPEVQAALRGVQGSSIRFSETIRQNSLYVSVPIPAVSSVGEEAPLLGVARVSLSLQQVEANVQRLQRTILSATLPATILAIILGLGIAERTARPVRRLTQVVQRVADGDMGARLLPASKDEVGELTAAFNEMSDRLRRQMTALAENSSRLSAVLANLADGVLMTDENGHVHVVNPAALRLLGTSPEAAIGRSFAEVVRHHRLIRMWQEARKRGEEQVEAIELDRQGIFWQAIVTPFQDGQRASYLVIIQDLTQLRRLETSRRDFVSNISHELRNPLASLKAVIETLQDGTLEDRPAAEHFLRRAEVEVDAMTQMVQELLELSRIESGRVPLRLSPTTAAEIVLPALERLRDQAKRAGLALEVEIASDLPRVLADAGRMEQVVVNLVHNAIKFTPAGGTIRIQARPAEGTAVLFKVSDSGVGIPAEDLPRIFERFYKADRARSGGGTGLGLAIAKHIVQAHDGRIWVESKEGRGSQFFFTLPAMA